MVLTRRDLALAGTASLTLLTTGAKAAVKWPGGARAAVSLTYDDGLDSQLDNVVPMLDEFGLKATFFLTIENMQARCADWVAVSKKGHEIGNHTLTHPCALKAYSGGRFFREQIRPAEDYLDKTFGRTGPRCFAYPCGFEGLGPGDIAQRVERYENVLRPTFLAARTVSGEANDPRTVMRNRYLLNAFEPTYDIDSPQLGFAYLDRTIQHGHWAILAFHEVLPARKGEGDTSKSVHRAILQRVMHRDVWCAPMQDIFGVVKRCH